MRDPLYVPAILVADRWLAAANRQWPAAVSGTPTRPPGGPHPLSDCLRELSVDRYDPLGFECRPVATLLLPDADHDGLPDVLDPDDDNDGIPDAIDPRPRIPDRTPTHDREVDTWQGNLRARNAYSREANRIGANVNWLA